MQPSLWARYIEELRGGTTQFIEYEWGFISYSFPDWAENAIYIEDMYVIPEERRKKRGTELFNAVCEKGRSIGARTVIAQFELASKVYVQSMWAQLAVGLVPIGAKDDKILMGRTL